MQATEVGSTNCSQNYGALLKDGRSLLESESQNQQHSDEGPGARTADRVFEVKLCLRIQESKLQERVSEPGS